MGSIRHIFDNSGIGYGKEVNLDMRGDNLLIDAGINFKEFEV